MNCRQFIDEQLTPDLCTHVFIQVLNAYLKFMTDIGVLLGGVESDRSLILERMREVIEFEQAIAQVLCMLCGLMCEPCGTATVPVQVRG